MQKRKIALACVSIFLLAGCGTEGSLSPAAAVTGLDGSTIGSTAVTERIEELTRGARVHGLTVTIA
jgi:hypothetical protein